MITDLFRGRLMSRTTCTQCGKQDLVHNNFREISLEIQPELKFEQGTNLSDCLEQFTRVEQMTNTGFYCEECEQEVNIEKDLTIFRFPRILVIHLNRFQKNAN